MSESTGVLRPADAGEYARRHDLDALRAVAMLLGIALHAALTFTDIPWVVQDRSREPVLGLLILLIHGFRMPAFFLLSGFFAAMLLRRYGLGGLLRHRARRIALPLLLSCVTILPVTWLVMGWAGSRGHGSSSVPADPSRDVWTAAARGDLDALRAHLEAGTPLDAPDPAAGHTPLAWAVIGDQPAALDYLLECGADPRARYRDENTALHTAAFFGRSDATRRLLEAGADIQARNIQDETPLDSLRHDQRTTEFIAGLLHVPVDFPTVVAGRDLIREMLTKRGATSRRQSAVGESSPGRGGPGGVLVTLTEGLFFHHLWFLWFLCWLLGGLAVVVFALRPLPRIRVPRLLVATPLCLLWLVPLTMLTQSAMHRGGTLPGFGADDSTGLLPMPHVLAHYAIFFGFGALMYGVPRAAEGLGRAWWLQLSLVALLTPATLALSLQTPWGRYLVGDEGLRRLLASLGQVLFAWLAVFGLMGLFQRWLSRERPGVRYVSDSSYWLYLAHLPLIIVGQVMLRDVDLPAPLKFSLLIAGSTAIVLASYQLLVRHTWVGHLLNGPRNRRTAQGSEGSLVVDASSTHQNIGGQPCSEA